MKKILIYCDEGASLFSVSSLLLALKQEKADQTHLLEFADKELLYETTWKKDTDLLIFPGGRDLPYSQSLKGESNHNIVEFVQNGGRFLGICAGGYYGSSMVDFERGGPLEVLGERELKFFPGTARGPAYGLRKFRYTCSQGAQIAQLSSSSITTAAYYNGGCAFIQAENYSNVSIIARYKDIEDEPAAIIKCQVGVGQVILSGVHPEFSAYFEGTINHIKGSHFLALKGIENERRTLFKSLLSQMIF